MKILKEKNNPIIRSQTLFYSALFVGLSLPLLGLGPAAFGASLALSFLCALSVGGFKTSLTLYAPLMSHKVTLGLIIAWICWLSGVLFSIRPALSVEAWSRSALIFCAIIFIFIQLRDHTDTIFKSLVLGLCFILSIAFLSLYIWPNLLGIVTFKFKFVNALHSFKPIVTGFVLLFPILLLKSISTRGGLRLLYVITSLAIIALAGTIHARAAIAGLGIGLFYAAVLYIIALPRRQRLRNGIFFAVLSLLSVLIMMSWLQTVMKIGETDQSLLFLPDWFIDPHRQMIWRFSFEKFLLQPWAGYGLNASNYMEGAGQTVGQYIGNQTLYFSSAQILPGHPHNWIVELALDGGLITLIPSAVMIGGISITLAKSYLFTKNHAYLAASMVHASFWGAGLFSFSFWSTWWQATYIICMLLAILPALTPTLKHQDIP